MPKLFMLLIGCSPEGRHIEQHDVFFGIGEDIKEVLGHALDFWPEAKKSFHLDGWREVTKVGDFAVKIVETSLSPIPPYLFFINLGGYKRGEFEEFHYKMITVAKDKHEAVKTAKDTAFFKHTGFKGATAHIDDKYGVDVDDIFLVKDILPRDLKFKYSLKIEADLTGRPEDELHLGYFRPEKVDIWANSTRNDVI